MNSSDPQIFFPCFGNDGGPLIVLPREALPYWEGAEPPSGGRIINAEFRWNGQDIATDYDRACDVGESSKLLAVGAFWGMVLGEADFTCDLWLRLPTPDVFLLLSIFDSGDCSRDDIQALYAQQPEENWTRLGAHLSVAHGELLLMHAASRGTEADVKAEDASYAVIGDAMRFPTIAGDYDIGLCEVDDPEGAHVLFHRFRLRRTAETS